MQTWLKLAQIESMVGVKRDYCFSDQSCLWDNVNLNVYTEHKKKVKSRFIKYSLWRDCKHLQVISDFFMNRVVWKLELSVLEAQSHFHLLCCHIKLYFSSTCI